jgi:hypothetical protein
MHLMYQITLKPAFAQLEDVSLDLNPLNPRNPRPYWFPLHDLVFGSCPGYACRMQGLGKWIAVLFIALVALSPIFEVFDTTDGWAQDSSDLARYVMCVFFFLAFSLRRHVLRSTLIFLRDWIISRIERPAIQGKFTEIFVQSAKDRGLFLAYHDFRI